MTVRNERLRVIIEKAGDVSFFLEAVTVLVFRYFGWFFGGIPGEMEEYQREMIVDLVGLIIVCYLAFMQVPIGHV